MEDGPRMDFTQYIYDLWERIGYSPSNVELDPVIDEDHATQTGGLFTPAKRTGDDSDKFTGVSIKTFPKDTDHGDIIEFLVKSGVPESHKDKIDIKQNGAVMIKDLSSSECEVLISVIHTKTHFGRRMFCNGIIPRTPDKADIPVETPAAVPLIPGPLSPL